jgi:polyisoprenoid-binding protein YceI
MKKKLIYGLFILTAVVLTACSGETKTEEPTEAKPACFYSYNSGTTVLEWTAFKFTEKAPVKGTFNNITITGMDSSDDAKKLIESLTFSIETSSVETQNPERNGKIAELFFGSISTPQLTGKVKSLSDNGKATIEIKMNNVKQDVVGEYTLEDGKFSFTSSIDVMKWNAGKGIDMLNTACKDLHTGADGKSKLWSEVDLSFSTELSSDCN